MNSNLNLGYYFNYLFTSTGCHLAAGEGFWKMEENYRFVAGRSRKPLAFSVVNAGNIREFVMELSANAAMMWNFKTYTSDGFLRTFFARYYGSKNANKAADLYNAYWKQKHSDLKGFDRQYIFQDLRYKREIQDICSNFGKPNTIRPFKDIPADQEPGCIYRIVPADNGAANDLDAVINGTRRSAAGFLQAAKGADALYNELIGNGKAFFNNNLRAPAYFMHYLNECLLQLANAYKSNDKAARISGARSALEALHQAENSLKETQHGNFRSWYAGDKIFGFDGLYKTINAVVEKL